MSKKVIFTKDHRAFYVEGDAHAELTLNGEPLTDEVDVSLADENEWDEIKKNPWDKNKLKKFSKIDKT